MTDPHDTPREIISMRIDLPAPVREPVWPAAIGLRSFTPAAAPALHALLEHGYRNGGGSVDSYEVWLPQLVGDDEFDADLCFLVIADGAVVAAAVCWTSAFVKDIVVHESWRRRGLGEALLVEVFRTFERRGASHVGLKVQAGNASAIALYELVGMTPV